MWSCCSILKKAIRRLPGAKLVWQLATSERYGHAVLVDVSQVLDTDFKAGLTRSGQDLPASSKTNNSPKRRRLLVLARGRRSTPVPASRRLVEPANLLNAEPSLYRIRPFADGDEGEPKAFFAEDENEVVPGKLGKQDEKVRSSGSPELDEVLSPNRKAASGL